MTGGGDLDEFEDDDEGEDIAVDVADDDDTDDGEDIAPPVAEPDLSLDLNDRIPAAGIADTGGRAADDPDAPA
jgi:hypothetical protein